MCPDFIREQWRERLIIDLDSSYPLDLSFAEDGIGADLSFGGYVTRCTFPWEAIYVVADRATGRGIVLDQNMPASVRRSLQPPTTGPLPDGDLSGTFEHERSKGRAPKRRKREPTPAAATGSTGSTDAAPMSSGEQEALRRRAAFKVIDGGG